MRTWRTKSWQEKSACGSMESRDSFFLALGLSGKDVVLSVSTLLCHFLFNCVALTYFVYFASFPCHYVVFPTSTVFVRNIRAISHGAR